MMTSFFQRHVVIVLVLLALFDNDGLLKNDVTERSYANLFSIGYGVMAECSSNPCLSTETCVDLTPTVHECRPKICLTEPCKNGANCTEGVDDYTCSCIGGFTGKNCDVPEEINPCLDVPCLNSGICYYEGNNTFTCECALGFRGETCSIEEDPCSNTPCLNGGQCSAKADGGVLCTCRQGFLGDFCEEEEDECSFSPCNHGGTCVDDVGGFTCHCTSFYTGPTCDENVNDCKPDSCFNIGECVDGLGTFSCICPEGFSGDRCQVNRDECNPDPCANGGDCHDGFNSFNCICRKGYAGTTCEINLDDCVVGGVSPCLNGGQCVDGVASYTCSCPNSYEGVNCELEKDECDTNPCVNGKCIDEVGFFVCSCDVGWTGNVCSISVSRCFAGLCQNGGRCVEVSSIAVCQCELGYSGSNCAVNINECARDICLNGGTCHDGLLSYTCDCLPGFLGENCEIDVDECEEDICLNGGICTNIPGSFECTCEDGFQGDFCEILEGFKPSVNGALGNPSLYLAGSPHYNTLSLRLCHALCLEDDDCFSFDYGVSLRICSLSSAVGPSNNNPNFMYFERINECPPDSCENGGSCSYDDFEVRCSCFDGTRGLWCEILDEFFPPTKGAPLVNGREQTILTIIPFLEVSSSQKCARKCIGFGPECLAFSYSRNKKSCSIFGEPENEVLIDFNEDTSSYYVRWLKDPCAVSKCAPGSTCVDSGEGTGICLCEEGKTGDLCDRDIIRCEFEPCRNGATCIDTPSGFFCTCAPGWTGKNCANEVDECALGEPCLHGGQCIDSFLGFSCECKVGFTGDRCELDVNECELEKHGCHPLAKCNNILGSYLCDCSEFEDKFSFSCIIQQSCFPNPCHNEGTCKPFAATVEDPSGFECDCSESFEGSLCELAAFVDPDTVDDEVKPETSNTPTIIGVAGSGIILLVVGGFASVQYHRVLQRRRREEKKRLANDLESCINNREKSALLLESNANENGVGAERAPLGRLESIKQLGASPAGGRHGRQFTGSLTSFGLDGNSLTSKPGRIGSMNSMGGSGSGMDRQRLGSTTNIHGGRRPHALARRGSLQKLGSTSRIFDKDESSMIKRNLYKSRSLQRLKNTQRGSFATLNSFHSQMDEDFDRGVNILSRRASAQSLRRDPTLNSGIPKAGSDTSLYRMRNALSLETSRCGSFQQLDGSQNPSIISDGSGLLSRRASIERLRTVTTTSQDVDSNDISEQIKKRGSDDDVVSDSEVSYSSSSGSYTSGSYSSSGESSGGSDYDSSDDAS